MPMDLTGSAAGKGTPGPTKKPREDRSPPGPIPKKPRHKRTSPCSPGAPKPRKTKNVTKQKRLFIGARLNFVFSAPLLPIVFSRYLFKKLYFCLTPSFFCWRHPPSK